MCRIQISRNRDSRAVHFHGQVLRFFAAPKYFFRCRTLHCIDEATAPTEVIGTTLRVTRTAHRRTRKAFAMTGMPDAPVCASKNKESA